MSQGLHIPGQDSVLEVYFRGSAQPGTDEFTLRLANSLLMRITGSTYSGWSVGEQIQGSTSSDTATIEGKKELGDGSVMLKLSGVGEAEVFSIGETVTGQTSGESGTLDNSVMNISNLSNSNFQLNESVVDQSTGDSADVKGGYVEMLELNNLNGTFGTGNTVVGQESGASATISSHYAGNPGMFVDDGIGDIVDEANHYTPPTLSANNTDWETLGTSVDGYSYIETKSITIEASGGDLGPINLAILTVNIDSGGEILVSTAPIKGTPPSEVITSGGNLTLKYHHKLASG